MAEVGFNIDEFRSKFQGGARSNLFFYRPMFPGRVSEITTENAQYLVRATRLPDSTLEEVLVNWQGYDYKMAGKYTYATFGITFNVDINSKIRLAYESWMKMINDPLTNERTLPSEYMVDQVVYLLDYKGIPSMTYKLYGAWPSNLAEVSLDYATADVAQFEVVLTYQFHEAFPGKEQ